MIAQEKKGFAYEEEQRKVEELTEEGKVMWGLDVIERRERIVAGLFWSIQ